MIIEVKGARSAPAENPAERYASRARDAKSKTPFAIGMVLIGIGLYLKSALSVTAGDQAARPAPLPAGEDAHVDGAEAGMEAITPADRREPARETENPAEPQAAPQVSQTDAGIAHPQAAARLSASDLAEAMAGEGLANGSRPSGVKDPGAAGAQGSGPVRKTGPQQHTPAPGANAGGRDGDLPGSESGDGGGDPEGPRESEGETDGEAPDIRNRAPRIAGPVQLPDVAACATLAIALSDFLRNASDPDGDALSVKNLSVSSGALIASDDGWIFSPAPGTFGPVTIAYQITDGELAVGQVAQLTILRSLPIEGSTGDDLLIGTSCADDIDGKDGDDNIDGRAGDDVIAGGDGDDHIVAGTGDDTVFAGTGNDIVFGGEGGDRLSGGAGDDRLFGEDGADVIQGGGGNDYLNGGNGSDILDGSDGEDTLLGGAGRDIVRGGAGGDHIIAAPDRAADVLEGGAGYDTLDYSSARAGVRIDLAAGTAIGIEIGTDTISGFEKLTGGDGADHFIAGSRGVILAGGGGANVFEFAPPSGPSASPVMHEILDFRTGDRVRIAQYELLRKPAEQPEDAFKKAYGESDAVESPLRFRQDRTDELTRTIVEADLDRDEIYETAIAIHGDHALAVVETA